MRALGFLILFGLLCFVVAEVVLLIVAGGWVNRTFEAQIGSGGWLVILLWLVAAGFIGVRLAKWHGTKIPAAFFAGNAGKHVIGAVGGVLLAVPGLMTDVIGLILLLPPVQTAFSKLGSAILSVVIKRVIGRFMGGGAGGLGGLGGLAGMMGGMGGGMTGGKAGGGNPGGNPFGGFPFPDMKPDDRVTLGGKKPGKTYDTTAEK